MLLRPTLVLVALSGCDVVFQLERVDVAKAACGPYRNVRAVAITGVTEPRQFTISEDEQLAFVFGIDDQLRQRPIALQWNGEAWEPHVDYQQGLEGRDIAGVRLAPFEEIPDTMGSYTGPVQPALNAWVVNTNRHQVARYYWSGTTWTPDAYQIPLFDGDYDTHAGNVIVVRQATNVHRVRHTVIAKLAAEAEAPNQILLHANTLPSYSLLPKPDRTMALNVASIDTVALTDAVLTENQATLVYAGVSGGQSDIYATAQSALREFAPGGLIEGITSSDDEVEPWITATCSKLYFRRIPSGSPNDPGQIYVAE
ncbi:MAG TPA: hypothetical protein VIV11_13915 [Kofleriaceae bacterium]